MALLTRDALVAGTDLPQETVAVPQLGGEVIVRGLTGAQRDAFEASMVVQKGGTRSVKVDNIRSRLLVRTIVDETGANVHRRRRGAARRGPGRRDRAVVRRGDAPVRHDARRCRRARKKLIRRPERRFAFMLARELGLPVGVMLGQMSGQELSEWQAFLGMEARVQNPIASGLTPGVAEAMVWSSAADPDGPAPPKKKRPKGY